MSFAFFSVQKEWIEANSDVLCSVGILAFIVSILSYRIRNNIFLRHLMYEPTRDFLTTEGITLSVSYLLIHKIF